MRAHILATQPRLVGQYRSNGELANDNGFASASPARRSSAHRPSNADLDGQLGAASMRVLEVSLAVAAIATALLAGVGR